MTLVNSKNVELTKKETETFLAEFTDKELDDASLTNVAGSSCINEDTSCWTLSN